MKELPDILVSMSDLHTALMIGAAGDKLVSTPDLDRLVSDGVICDNAYGACPLCIPARSAVLTGQQVSRFALLSDAESIPSDQATYLYCVGDAGCETVLAGRMHFFGPDQWHGFTRHLMGDFVPCLLGRGGAKRKDLGPYVLTLGQESDRLYGGGNSPGLEYDHAVIKAAMDYLRQPLDRPVYLDNGTIGPYHTFVAPEELYRKYLEKIAAPASASVSGHDMHPAVATRQRRLGPKQVKRMQAAYYGMIEQIDTQFGLMREAWNQWLERSGQPVCYRYPHRGFALGTRYRGAGGGGGASEEA